MLVSIFNKSRMIIQKFMNTVKTNLLFFTGNILFLYILTASNASFASSTTIRDVIKNITKEITSVEITNNLEKLSNIKGIIFIGSSGSGKTFLVNTLRRSVENISFPIRYITRPVRQNDDLQENRHLSNEEFINFIKNRIIDFFWERKLDNNRTVLYGFHRNKLENKLPIYSANNAVFNSNLLNHNTNYLIIGVHAPENIRKTRLSLRSPDLSRTERKHRVVDPHKTALNSAHLVINNYGDNEKYVKGDIMKLVNNIIKIKPKWGIIKNLKDYKIEYKSRLFDIVNHTVEFSDGVKKNFQFARRSPGVRSLIIKDNKILITKEWRTEFNNWDYRLPGGKVFENAESFRNCLDKSIDHSVLLEKAQYAAAKEVKEEAKINISPLDLKHEHTSKCGATIEWDLYYFATVNPNIKIPKNSYVETEEGEKTIVQWLPIEKVLDLCLENKVQEDRTAAFLVRYILKHFEKKI